MRGPATALALLLGGCAVPYAHAPATGTLSWDDDTPAQTVSGRVALHLDGSGNVMLEGADGIACEANYSRRDSGPFEGFMWCAPGYAGQVYIERPEGGVAMEGRRYAASGSAWLVGQPDTPVAGRTGRLRFAYD